VYHDLLRMVADEQRRFGFQPQPPCSDAQIERLSERVGSELRMELPDGYKDFLRYTNGFDWNGVVVFAAETVPIAAQPDRSIAGLVEMNHIYRDDERFGPLLVFGSDGMDIYAYNGVNRVYAIYDEVPHELVETLPSFAEMITKALTRSLR
jgi:hypothetical protein